MRLQTRVGVLVAMLLSATTAAVWAQGQPPPPQTTQPGLQAGGLAPPAPMQTSGPGSMGPTSAEQHLRQSEREDSGRGLEWFYVNAEAGLQHLGLQTFKSNKLAFGNVNTSGVGFMYGGGLGFRVLYYTFGARARVGNFSDFKAATIGGDFGFHIPLGNLEPNFSLGIGYAFLTSMTASKWGSSDVSVRGADVRLGAGLDYYLTPAFSIGGNLTGEMLILSRPGLTQSQLKSGLTAAQVADAKSSGSSIGASWTLSAVLGLHF